MGRYRVTCNIINMDSNRKIAQAVSVGIHPDICKQEIESRYPKHFMSDIRIEVLEKPAKTWDMK